MTAPFLQIAIDGPVASGKGEIAGRLAHELHILYIYTGAMYRALALACIEAAVPLKDESGVLEILQKSVIDMAVPDAQSPFPYKVLLNGRDVTQEIQKQDAAQGASDVGTIPAVRQWMVARQQEMAKERSVVMEGRDIAVRVLPNAHLKIYLTASLEERAKRRYAQWQAQGLTKTLAETIEDTKVRDHQDMSRDIDPLEKLSDAWELDTTAMSPDVVITTIKNELMKRGLL